MLALRSLLTFAAMAAVAPAQLALLEPSHVPGRQAAAAALEQVLDGRHDLPTSVALAATAGTELAEGSAARARLRSALVHANTTDDAARALGRLRLELGELLETLTFRPVDEAELPRGFPGFVAVDEIELRNYPAYRMARTAMRGGANGAFWPLFRHIESNGIAMTAPVQTDLAAAEDRPLTMAFLYGDPDIQPARTAEDVEVVDVAPSTVLSIGATGYDRKAVLEAMRQRLCDFVAASQGAWEIAGPARTMSYNGPMVRGDRRYFEVQLPVRRADVAR